MLKRNTAALALIITSFIFALPTWAKPEAEAEPVAADTVLVLPFENTSSHREFNWVGESFSDELSELLNNANWRIKNCACL